MTGDGTHTYQWDAEDRMVSVDGGSTASYKYNVLGQRVERYLPNGSYTFDYPFGLSGEELGIYSAGGATWFGQNVPMGGRILVQYGSTILLQHANNLGTSTAATDQTGAELQDELFYPWGQDWTRAGLPYVMHFAGMHQLQDAGLYPTPNRDFTPSLGRWMSPDLLGGDVTNPQSLNRYAYVTNNPTSLTDPSGLGPCDAFEPWNCPPSCDPFDSGDCQCNPNDGGICVRYCYELGTCNGRNGGGGGGSSGGGGAPAPPGAPPAGQPPLAGGAGSNAWVSNTITAPGADCYGHPGIIPGLPSSSGEPCFLIFVTSSATLGGYLSTSPGPGARIGNGGVVPTHNYWEYLGCVYDQLIAKQIETPEEGGLTVLLNAAPFAKRTLLKASPEFYLVVAGIWDLGLELKARAVCSQQVYGGAQ